MNTFFFSDPTKKKKEKKSASCQTPADLMKLEPRDWFSHLHLEHQAPNQGWCLPKDHVCPENHSHFNIIPLHVLADHSLWNNKHVHGDTAVWSEVGLGLLLEQSWSHGGGGYLKWAQRAEFDWINLGLHRRGGTGTGADFFPVAFFTVHEKKEMGRGARLEHDHWPKADHWTHQ